MRHASRKSRGVSAYLQLEVLAVAVPSSCGAEAVQLLAGSVQVHLQELVRPCQLEQQQELIFCWDAECRYQNWSGEQHVFDIGSTDLLSWSANIIEGSSLNGICDVLEQRAGTGAAVPIN